jgi:hypothetical protein
MDNEILFDSISWVIYLWSIKNHDLLYFEKISRVLIEMIEEIDDISLIDHIRSYGKDYNIYIHPNEYWIEDRDESYMRYDYIFKLEDLELFDYI